MTQFEKFAIQRGKEQLAEAILKAVKEDPIDSEVIVVLSNKNDEDFRVTAKGAVPVTLISVGLDMAIRGALEDHISLYQLQDYLADLYNALERRYVNDQTM